MGKFIYEGSVKTEIEDRALTHLQLVITAKLRRAEPFSFSWREDASVGGGRTTVWIQPGSSLVFEAYLDGYCASPYMFWIGEGAVHGGSPGNPLELVPSE